MSILINEQPFRTDHKTVDNSILTAGHAVIISLSELLSTVKSTTEPFHLSLSCRSQVNSLLQTVLLITSRHGPDRKHPIPTVSLLLRAYSFPRERAYRSVAQKRSLYIRLYRSHCIATSVVSFVSRSSLSNWSIRHSN
jgi:hypothetical protein